MRALERVGLGALAQAYPHMLSGGEQQRVALARAVAPRPSVLLMDEPFSGLDRRLRDEVREDTLNVLRESRVTCIIVTHDPEEALRMGDRIALMNKGSLVQVGTPAEIYTRPKDLFVARFFCDLNEVDGTVRGGVAETVLGRFAAPGLAEGSAAIVAIRPQASAHPAGWNRRPLPHPASAVPGPCRSGRSGGGGARFAAEGPPAARRHPAG